MDEITKIRKQHFIEGKNIHFLAKRFNRSWATIQKILETTPEDLINRGKRPNRTSHLITEDVSKRINELFDEEELKKVHRKQKYTKRVIFNILRKENLYNGTERHLRTVINGIQNSRDVRSQSKKSFLYLEFPFGLYLQIDHGEVDIVISGVRTTGYLFVATIPGVPIRYCQIFLTKASEAWGEFHERTFAYYGGIFENCMYDNDSVLKATGSGINTAFFTEIQIHYGFAGINCNKASGWEKGAVENAVGYCRRNFLAGLPEADNAEELNRYLIKKCEEDLTNVCDEKLLSDWKLELKNILKPLKNPKKWEVYSELKVNPLQTITYHSLNYSVPEKYVGSMVRVLASVSRISIFNGTEFIYEHERNYFEKDEGLVLDHFLDQLLRKPKAILFSKVVNKTKFEQNIIDLKRRMREKYSYPEGDAEFIKTLCLKKRYGTDHFSEAIDLALSYGSLTSQGIECIIKQLTIQSISPIPKTLLPQNCVPPSPLSFDLMKYKELVQNEVTHVG